MTTTLIVAGSVFFVAAVFVLCNCRVCDCRNENKGYNKSYKVIPGIMILGLVSLTGSVIFFLLFNWYSTVGYSAGNCNLIQNAVYEVVSSGQVDERSVAILREPDRNLRFFTFRDADIKIEKGQFLKAVGDDSKSRKLLPLVPSVSSVKATP